MKRLILLAIAGLVFTGCSKSEDAPAPYVPHVAGQWAGNGTDDVIGYFNWSVVLTQSNSQAAGTYTTSSSLGTTTGDIRICFGPEGQTNVRTLTMTQTGGTLSHAVISGVNGTITNTSLVFSYFPDGGANLHKVAGTN